MADSDTTGRQAFWDGMWSSDAEDPFWNQVDPEVAALAGSTSPQDRPDVLDLGCGLGRNAIAFARAGYRVTAVDFSEEGLGHLRARAAELGLTMRIQPGRFTDDAFEPETFDIVLAVNVIYHGTPADFARAVAHAHRWLRTGGQLYFTCPTLDDGDFGDGTAVAPNTFELEPGHIHYYASWDELEVLLADFRLVSRKQRDHTWDRKGVNFCSSRWQVLVEKP